VRRLYPVQTAAGLRRQRSKIEIRKNNERSEKARPEK
jgi:hypothetical protein